MDLCVSSSEGSGWDDEEKNAKKTKDWGNRGRFGAKKQKKWVKREGNKCEQTGRNRNKMDIDEDGVE